MPNVPVSTVAKDEPPSSLWADLEDVLIEYDEFDEMFSRPVINKGRKKKEDKKEESIKVAVAKCLDPKRSQNVGIFIKSKQIEMAEVENTIYNFDASVIDFETLGQIKANQGTSDELSMIKGQVEACPDIPLDKPEQFLLDLSKISHFNERLECFMFQTRFSDAIQDIENRMMNIKHVCNLLKDSTGMMQVFQVILTLGNYMNGGNTQRGQADGFNIDILPKLKDVKSKDNSLTFLQYVVRICILKFDANKGTIEAVMPVPEPSDVDRCCNINFDDQHTECEKLEKDLVRIEKSKDKVVAESAQDYVEPFKTKMTAFLEEANVSLKELKTLVNDCSILFFGTMKFYLFKPKDGNINEAQPKDFFSIWSPFCTDYKNAWKKEQAKIAAEMLKEERKRITMKTEKLRNFKTKPIEPNGFKQRMLERKRKSRAKNWAFLSSFHWQSLLISSL